MLFVGLASWHRRANTLESHSRAEQHGPRHSETVLWSIVVDVSQYIRYLQFMFLAASLTMEYPGYYQPVVSQIAWSSLLYWSGPINHGFTYRGVEDGMYVSNASYGLEYMSQMLGFPQMTDVMFDSFINLFLVVSGLVVVIVVALYLTFGSSQKSRFPSALRDGSYIVLGVTLSFFNFPLLSFMSYELILIGYLPNYRVILVALGMVMIVLANYLNVRHFDSVKDHSQLDDPNLKDQPSLPWEVLRTFTHYLPHVIPLVQGIMIGGLQDYGLVQILVLGFCETVYLIHAVVQQRFQIIASRNAWCAAVRLLTLCLSISFTTFPSETCRQWIGYLMLCLHGAVILTFFLLSIWHFYCAFRRGQLFPGSSASQSVALTDIQPICNSTDDRSTLAKNSLVPRKSSLEGFAGDYRPGSSGTSSYRGFRAGISFNNYHHYTKPPTLAPTNTKHYVTDFSAFYRAPRARPGHQSLNTDIESRPTSDSPSPPAESSGESLFDIKAANRLSRNTLDEWLDIPGRSSVDYSVRESDQFYGRRKISGADSESPSTAGLTGNNSGELSGSETVHYWTRWAAARLKQYRKPKEKGFQVMRPPRPGPSGEGGPA